MTARKVEERLQDVPLAITAFSAAEIQAAGIENLNDVANLTPGMTFSNLIGEFLPVPVIRGIAPTAVQDRENNAAIFVDGVYVSGRQGLNFSPSATGAALLRPARSADRSWKTSCAPASRSS